MAKSAAYKWIMYLKQEGYGLSFDIDRVESLNAARDRLAEFRRDSGDDEGCYADLYAYSPDGWESAEEFADTGCPFECADYRLTFGPRGGIVTEKG